MRLFYIAEVEMLSYFEMGMNIQSFTNMPGFCFRNACFLYREYTIPLQYILLSLEQYILEIRNDWSLLNEGIYSKDI